MMDPLSATSGILQVITQCAVCTVTLAKWIGQMRTVNERLESFSKEILALKMTQENLKQSLEMPSMVEAARRTNDTSGNLWTQIFVTLEDCKTTLMAINQTLEKINKPSKFGRPLKVLLESLNSGDLGRYHQRIQMFNVSLQLPMQMITITLQLSQHDISEESHRQLMNEIGLVKHTTEITSGRLKTLKQIYTDSSRRVSITQSSTMVDVSHYDGAIYDNLDKCMDKVQGFLSGASTVASAMSSTSSVIRDGALPNPIRPVFGTSEHGVALTQRERLRIDSWVPAPNQPKSLPTPAESEHDQSQSLVHQLDHLEVQDDGDEDDVDLVLAQTYIESGQKEMEEQTEQGYAAAEENFWEALELLKSQDFGQKLAFERTDVTLMLAECCFKQGKNDEAIKLLSPLVQNDSQSQPNQSADVVRELAAEQLLGEVYLHQKNYEKAEVHGNRAFTGRRRHLREHHPKSLESVRLMVDIYRGMGKMARANAYGKFLHPRQPRTMSQTEEALVPIFTPPSPTPGESTIPRRMTSPTIAIAAVSSNRISPELQQAQLSMTRSMSVNPQQFDNRSNASTAITRTSTRHTEIQSVSRSTVEPKFLAVKALAAESKDKAVSMAMNILKTYDPEPSRILIHRTDEIKKNIKKRGLDMGLAATGYGYAPIHFFCELSIEPVAEVEFLIEQGVNLGAVRHKPGFATEPMTPLQLVIEKGHEKLAIMMIYALNSASAIGQTVPDVNTMLDKDNFPPLLAACRRGQVMVVQRLLEYGARPAAVFPRTWYGNSLLHDAASRCDKEMVRLLLEYQDQTGSKTDQAAGIGSLGQQDKFGITPLMYAVMSTNIISSQRQAKVNTRQECVRMLLDHGVRRRSFEQDLLLKDEKGRDVFALAELENDDALQTLLSPLQR